MAALPSTKSKSKTPPKKKKTPPKSKTPPKKKPSRGDVVAIYQHESNFLKDEGVTTTKLIPHWAKSLWEPFSQFCKLVRLTPENVAFQEQYNNLVVLWKNGVTDKFKELHWKMYDDFMRGDGSVIGQINLGTSDKERVKVREKLEAYKEGAWAEANPTEIWADVARVVGWLLNTAWTDFERRGYYVQWLDAAGEAEAEAEAAAKVKVKAEAEAEATDGGWRSRMPKKPKWLKKATKTTKTTDGAAYARWTQTTEGPRENDGDDWIKDGEFRSNYAVWIRDTYEPWFEASVTIKLLEAQYNSEDEQTRNAVVVRDSEDRKIPRHIVREQWISLGPEHWGTSDAGKFIKDKAAEAIAKAEEDAAKARAKRETAKAKREADAKAKTAAKTDAKYAGFGDDYFGHEYGMIGDTYSQRNVVPSYSGYGGHSNGMPLAYNNGDYGSEILALSLIMNVVLFMALFCLMCWICAAVCGYYLGYKLTPRKYRIKIPNHDSSESEAINQV